MRGAAIKAIATVTKKRVKPIGASTISGSEADVIDATQQASNAVALGQLLAGGALAGRECVLIHLPTSAYRDGSRFKSAAQSCDVSSGKAASRAALFVLPRGRSFDGVSAITSMGTNKLGIDQLVPIQLGQKRNSSCRADATRPAKRRTNSASSWLAVQSSTESIMPRHQESMENLRSSGSAMRHDGLASGTAAARGARELFGGAAMQGKGGGAGLIGGAAMQGKGGGSVRESPGAGLASGTAAARSTRELFGGAAMQGKGDGAGLFGGAAMQGKGGGAGLFGGAALLGKRGG